MCSLVFFEMWGGRGDVEGVGGLRRGVGVHGG